MNTNGSANFHKLYEPPLKVLLPASIMLWFAIALFNTGIFIFSDDEQILQYGFLGALKWTLLYHSPWLFLTLCIVCFARRFPLNGKIVLKNICIHVGLALCVIFIASLLHTQFIYIRLDEPFEYSSLYGNFLFYLDDRVLLYLVILIGYYAVDFYRKKNREAMRELQLQEKLNREKLNRFKNDIQPAFLLNTLKDIQELVPEDPVLAERLIADLAHMIRKLLISSQRKNTSTYDDLQFLKFYIAILGSRIGKEIHFYEHVNEKDKSKHLAASLTVISIVEQLLNKDKRCFSALETFRYRTFETEDKEGVEVEFNRLVPARPDFNRWIKNGGGEILTERVNSSHNGTGNGSSNGVPELRYTRDGLFTISIAFQKNVL